MEKPKFRKAQMALWYLIAVLAVFGKLAQLGWIAKGETVAIRTAGDGLVEVNVPDSSSNQVWTIEYSADLTNWSWCATQTTGAAPVMFFAWSNQYFRARKD